VYAVEFLMQSETGLLIPQNEVANYYHSSFVYGGALQVSFPGPKELGLGIRAELLYSSLRSKTQAAGFKNSFSLMPLIGSAVVSIPLGNDVKASLLGGIGYYRNNWTTGAESDDQFYMGYNGGLELDMAIMSGLAIGVQTRYHLVTGCRGESDDEYLSTLFVIKMRHAHGSDHH
jgi:hypothetical protein